MAHFGALPHLTIARNDRTEGIDYLTKLSMTEYDDIWAQFQSGFWEYKKTIFGVRQENFCYAGKWSLYINLCSGNAKSCYCGASLGDVFKEPHKPFPQKPIGYCPLPHCYNGHALLTLGLIPHITNVHYGDIRNRVCEDGTEWLQSDLKEFFNTQLIETNRELSKVEQGLQTFVSRVAERIPKKNNYLYVIKTTPNRLMMKVLGENSYNRFKQWIKKK